jgi:hypothetical protein
LFSFERDPHARAGKVEFQKAQLLQILSMQLYHRECQAYGF